MQHKGLLTGLGVFGLLAQPLPASQAAAQTPQLVAPAAKIGHQRVLPLEGGRNFRDLGGYPAADGRTVKWDVLFRSGSMHGLTAADHAALAARGIRTICDFRDNRERAAEPVVWPARGGPQVLTTDYQLDSNGMFPPDAMAKWTAPQVRFIMAATYPRLLEQYNGQYRRMFGELLAQHVPLAFNCSAGKDRTGIAAALLLTALGVPRETIIEDYLLTNTTLDSTKMFDTPEKAAAAGPFASLPADVLKPFMAADRSYIESALRVIDNHPGGAEAYLHDRMGLSTDDLQKLRNLYLQ